MAKWGKVPLLETYRQMAIRQQKKKDWETCKWWAERGLALYGQRAVREEAVEDLMKRRNRAVAKLENLAIPGRQLQPDGPWGAVIAVTPSGSTQDTADSDTELEVLSCHECGCKFERMRVRGRKPALCPPCRTSAKA
jgi:hypothetical protein